MFYIIRNILQSDFSSMFDAELGLHAMLTIFFSIHEENNPYWNYIDEKVENK